MGDDNNKKPYSDFDVEMSIDRMLEEGYHRPDKAWSDDPLCARYGFRPSMHVIRSQSTAQKPTPELAKPSPDFWPEGLPLGPDHLYQTPCPHPAPFSPWDCQLWGLHD